MFTGLPEFQEVMKIDTSKAIRAFLCFYPHYNHEVAVGDLL